jgi:hypothetical protein
LLMWARPTNTTTATAQPGGPAHASDTLARIAPGIVPPQGSVPRRASNLRPSSSTAPVVASQTTAREEDGSRNGRRKERYEWLWDETVDLAGLCFDAKGTKMYVASTRAVAEWEVKGSEKRWWTAGAWA